MILSLDVCGASEREREPIPKESEKVRKGVPGPPASGTPESPKSAPRSPKRVQKESEAGICFCT